MNNSLIPKGASRKRYTGNPDLSSTCISIPVYNGDTVISIFLKLVYMIFFIIICGCTWFSSFQVFIREHVSAGTTELRGNGITVISKSINHQPWSKKCRHFYQMFKFHSDWSLYAKTQDQLLYIMTVMSALYGGVSASERRWKCKGHNAMLCRQWGIP